MELHSTSGRELDLVVRRKLSSGRHWSTAFRCDGCKTVIRYVDEVPAWRESEVQRAEWEAARAFAEEHRGERLSYSGGDEASRILGRSAEIFFGYLDIKWEAGIDMGGTIEGVVACPDLRCIDCPVCGAELTKVNTIHPKRD